MSQNITFNGLVYVIPDTGETDWGNNLTDFFIALPQGALQKTGGTFTLTADANFGANFGLVAQYIKSRSASVSTSGIIRLAVGDSIGWKNNGGGGNLLLAVNGSDQLTFNGTAIQPSGNYITALTTDVVAAGPGSVVATIQPNVVSNAKLRQSAALSVMGNATNALANVADITAGTDGFVLVRSGTTLTFGYLVNANIDAAAGIAFSKLASLTSAHILVGSAGNVASDVAVTGDISISNTGVTAYSGVVPLLKGGTGTAAASANAAFNALSPTSTKGDLISYSSTNARVAVGADGEVLTADSASTPGVKWAAPAASPTQSYEMSNLGVSCSVAANALTLALKQADGTSNPAAGASAVKVGFRSATVTSGAYLQRSVTAATAVVVSSGSTLGTSNGADYYLYVYAIDNAGTVELAVSMRLFPDYSVVSTTAEGGAGAADSNAVLYSTTARANVACRVIARIKVNEATAGTWASAPSEVSLCTAAIKDTVAMHYTGSVTAYSGSLTAIAFSTKDFDTTNSYSGSTFTVNTPGEYEVNAALGHSGTFALNTLADMRIYKNGSFVSRNFMYAGGAVTALTTTISDIIPCAVGDTLQIFSSSGAGSPVLFNDSTSHLSIVRVGD